MSAWNDLHRAAYCAAMHNRTQVPFIADQIAAAAEAGVALYTLTTQLPQVDASGEPPEWITVFSQLGQIMTRDGRTFEVDGQKLMSVFADDGIDLPIDINHSTSWAMGDNARASGWVKELRVDGSRLDARVEWLEEGKSLLRAKQYKYLSPAFYHNDLGQVSRLMAVSMVNSPALARQPALASAGRSSISTEKQMKSFAKALGLADGANEAECLSALNERLAGSVSKKVHDEALSQLSAASTELAEIKSKARAEKVDGLIEAALSAKKILPAEKDHYLALCSTDDGLASVEKLLDAKMPLLSGSGLDQKPQPEGGDSEKDPVKLAELAAKLQDDEAKAGRVISMAQAMTRVTEQRG